MQCLMRAHDSKINPMQYEKKAEPVARYSKYIAMIIAKIQQSAE